VEKILQNSLRNFCEYLLANNNRENKLYQTIEQILSEEIDRCIEKLNTNNEFKSKINRFVLDVVHRSALKGEDVILELARKFLEGLTDKQLNELVYDKVETDMIWLYRWRYHRLFCFLVIAISEQIGGINFATGRNSQEY
jgi:uncharacterized membrane-anchored protein YjiN (DUF445 family)